MRTYHFISLWILMGCFIGAMSQPLYFNKRITPKNSLASSINSVITVNDSIYSVGLFYNDSTYNQDILMCKINPDGSSVVTKTYSRYLYTYYGSRNIVCVNNKLYTAHTVADTAGNSSSVLACFNLQVDTVFTKHYYTSYFQSMATIATDGERLYMFGTTDKTDPNGDYQVICTDTLGNKLWQNEFGGSFSEIGLSIAVLNRNNILLFGTTESYGSNQGSTSDLYAVLVDSTGQRKWERTYGTVRNDVAGGCIATANGEFVVAGGYTYIEPQSWTISCKPWLIRIDTLGNTVWEKKYGEIGYLNSLNAVKELPNGNIVGCGRVAGQWDNKGLFIRTTAQGDSLIYRKVSYLKGYQSSNYIYGMTLTSEGGIVACGEVNPQPPDTGSSDGWIVKLDSLGCDSAGCPPVTVGIANQPSVPEQNILLYPNPFNNQLTVSLPQNIADINTEVHLEAYTMQGRLIWEGDKRGNIQKISTTTWPPGAYLLRMTNTQGWQDTQKVLKR